MNTTGDGDLSTLARLRPGESFSNPYKQLRSSMRYQGSFFLNLAKPKRLPDNSRKYQAGDPINLIDWRAYARTNQLLVREVRDEAAARIRVVIDGSQSMVWPDADVEKFINGPATAKLEIAIRAAFYTAFYHVRNGDFVELWIAPNGDVPQFICNAKTPSDYLGIFHGLEAGQFDPQELLKGCLGKAYLPKQTDILYWFGDGLSGESSPLTKLAEAAHGFWFHTLSDFELSADWVKQDISYFDEGDDASEYLGKSLLEQNNYQKAMERWLNRLRTAAREQGSVFETITESTPIAAFQAVLKSHQLIAMGR